MKLLTAAASNAKTAKNDTEKYLSFILHLSPEKTSGYNVCAAASLGCKLTCLNTAGRGRFSNVQNARIRKTKLFFQSRNEFWQLLIKDLIAVEKKAKKLGKIPVVRLNGTSDLPFEKFKIPGTDKNIFELFPTIQFYDYTAIFSRLVWHYGVKLPNYYLIFSRKETNATECYDAIKLGYNVAVVFRNELPKNWIKRPVINGDNSDLRFLDQPAADGIGNVVALKAKGRAKKDTTGFVIDFAVKKQLKAG